MDNTSSLFVVIIVRPNCRFGFRGLYADQTIERFREQRTKQREKLAKGSYTARRSLLRDVRRDGEVKKKYETVLRLRRNRNLKGICLDEDPRKHRPTWRKKILNVWQSDTWREGRDEKETGAAHCIVMAKKKSRRAGIEGTHRIIYKRGTKRNHKLRQAHNKYKCILFNYSSGRDSETITNMKELIKNIFYLGN